MPDYEFYVKDFLGEDIPEQAFDRLARRASDLLERYRRMFAVTPREGFVCAEECAVCAIAEAMYAFEQEDSRRGLSSVSVGSVSESYTAPPELCPQTLHNRETYYRDLARDYLRISRRLPRGSGYES
ncbi:MAG: hypothetical protein ACI4KN_05105 [Gemmiger sp.]